MRKGINQVADWENRSERNFSALQEFFKRHKTPEREIPEEFVCFKN